MERIVKTNLEMVMTSAVGKTSHDFDSGIGESFQSTQRYRQAKGGAYSLYLSLVCADVHAYVPSYGRKHRTANQMNQYAAFTYDAGGEQKSAEPNMTRLGNWLNTWDGTDRLIKTEPYGLATNGAVRFNYQYNHRNLQAARITERLSGRGAGYPMDPSQPGSWDAVKTHTFVYDGWNLVLETIAHTNGSVDRIEYVWGLDLSGTFQGAGGVGGLLFEKRNGQIFMPLYDANANVTDYFDAYGTVRARYVYSPFGETVEQSGDLADTFLFRFSTKPFHQAAGLYKYQFRDFSPTLGCWLSRDPIEEEGGVNLYVVCDNNTVCFYDTVGLVRMITVPWKVMRIREGLLSIVSGNPLDYISIKWKILKGIKSAYDLYGRYTDAQLTTVRAIELFSQDVPWCYVLKRIERGKNAEFDSIELGGGEGMFGSVLEARIRFKVIDTHVYGPLDNRSGW